MITATSSRVHRTGPFLRPDQSRVLLRPFSHEDPERFRRIIARIMSLPESQVGPLLSEVSAEFSKRHQHIRRSFLERFEQVRDFLVIDKEISEQRQLLIGSYFVCEYSLESAALFNPSIVPHPWIVLFVRNWNEFLNPDIVSTSRLVPLRIIRSARSARLQEHR
jgi:hypothetical protein